MPVDDRFSRFLVGLVVSCILSLPGAELLALSVGRETGQYVRKVWKAPADGLPSNVVQAILQTRDGYLWLGTESGLVRFDGVSFTTFDTENSPGLGHNTIQDLAEDASGNLWIATWGGGLTRYSRGQFTSWSVGAGLTSSFIRSVVVDKDDSVWLGTFGKGVFKFENGVFTHFGEEHGLCGLEIRTLFLDVAGRLWVGTRKGGLCFLDGQTFRMVSADQGLPSDYVTALAQDNEGRLWVGTSAGVARLEGDRFTTWTQNEGLSGDRVSTIYQDRDGNVWVGTRGAGLNRLREDGFVSFSAGSGDPGDHVRTLYEDKEGNLWVGTYGGLVQLADGTVVTHSIDEGLSNDLVWPILQDLRGDLWVGTWNGLNRWTDGEFQVFTEADGLPANGVFSLAEDSQGNLWIGTFGGGLAKYSDAGFSTITRGDGLADDTIWALFEDSKGALWIGTNGGGVQRLKDGHFDTFTTKEGLSDNIISVIYEDDNGVVWIGTRTAGLNRLEDGQFTLFNSDNGLPNDEVRCIYEAGDGTLWIGTRGGLVRLKNGQFSTIGMAQGLPDRIAYWVLEDDQHNLWVSSSRGIYRVALDQLNAVADGKLPRVDSLLFGEADGMKRAECNGGSQPAGWKTRDGHLWFPTSSGAVTIDPEAIFRNKVPPPLYLEKARLDDTVYTRWTMPEETLQTGPGLERLEVHYAALSFAAPHKNRYRYKLDGFDDKWIEAGTRRTAYYTSLPPGKYQFRVMACNNDGVWTAEDAGFSFEVTPHFTQTFPFYALGALGFFLLGAGILYLRIRRLRQHQEMLENQVEERTQDLADANRKLHKAYGQLQETNELLEDTNLQLEILATSDALTSVANRRLFDQVLAMEFKRHARHKRQLSLVLLDIDYFKKYNDAYGHPGGDECLKKVASALKHCVHRSDDLLARYGGEEFAVVLPETLSGGALDLARKLNEAVSALALEHRDSDVASHVTISLGVATMTPGKRSTPQELVDAADAALYMAKEAGRNRAISTAV